MAYKCRVQNVWLVFMLLSILFLYSSCNQGNQPKEPQTFVERKDSLRNFIVNSTTSTKDQALSRLDSILLASGKDSAVFHQAIDFLSKPLSDPNSSHRNEDLYIEVLKAIIQSPWYDSLGKARSQQRLQLAMQNRPGEPANDFTYITPKGRRKRLYDVVAPFIVLFFYNPECPACKDVKAEIMQSSVINNSINTSRLTILAIYTEPELDLWRRHLPEMPVKWIAGHDEAGYLFTNSIYDLHAMPTVYLLDKDKNVLLKDCTSIQLIEDKLR